MGKPKYRIVIIEPAEVVQEGLRKVLNEKKIFEITTVFSNLSNFKNGVPVVTCDAIIVNPKVFEYRGKSLVRNVLENKKSALIAIVYDLFCDDILNQFDSIININDGADKIFKTICDSIDYTRRNESQKNDTVYELSDRELEILTSVANGMTNKEIAFKHNISVYTVISHRKNISRKTGIKTVSGLTVYAILNGLVTVK